MKKGRLILGLVVLAALAGFGVWAWHRIHFDFAMFRAQLAQADWRMIAAAVGCIYLGYVFRSVRWALLLRHTRKIGPLTLVGTQVMGFTAVALIGRLADPVRPYLVSKKTGLPLGSQIAVYIVERLLDAGAMALVFSIALLWVPADEILRVTAHSGWLAALARNHRMAAVLAARFGGLALTVLGAAFLVVVRLAGPAVASFFEHALRPLSKNLAQSMGHKVRSFHSGLDTMRSFGDFATAALLSLCMWLLIALAYFLATRAYVASPELASLTPPKCVLLMIASGGASILQLPVLGWFSQIGLVAVALAALGASPEAATACAATLLLVTFLSIIPAGLIWAQIEHVSLRRVTAESGHAGEALAANEAGHSEIHGGVTEPIGKTAGEAQ
ncbi:MAG TPA: lysylphosphatidylglycerol synthase transmembrane domain-containing protein [Terracidiphilus sp.]|nr:lysylphosphatidylglycerol synthase transmembrane domain-containing protein [Terracidiphilus sp.]